MLTVKNITIAYRKVPVIRDVSFGVSEGEVVAMVGSNGAGKSTLLHCIAGLMSPYEGEIAFLGERIENQPAYNIAKKGLCLIPEGSRVFSKLSIEDNLRMATFAKNPGYMAKEVLETVYTLFPVLLERRKLHAETLSGGERQMLAVGRALISQPKLLMLDEPTSGLAPKLADQVFGFIEKIKNMGVTILLVEQQVEHALEISERAYVLENGEIVMQGPASDVVASDMVRKAYLGL